MLKKKTYDSKLALSVTRIIAFIQDTHTISDIMRAEALPDFRASSGIPKFIDASTTQSIEELSSCDSSSALVA